ncbi:MAG: hypothetical protein U0359_30925 [Byssovorax sp.]
MASRLLSRALLLAALLAAPAAHAEPSKGERDAARALMDLGDRKIEAKDYPAALKAFTTADAIMGVPTTGIEVARTQVLLGHLVLGWEAASKVARFPRKPNEPDAFTRARAEGEALAGKLLPRIPTLRIKVEGAPAGAPVELTLDGEPLPASAAATPLKVDPGKHEVAASLPGGARSSVTVTLGEGESSPALLRLGGPASDEAPTDGSTRSILLYVGLGVTGAGLVTGAIAGGLSLGRTASIKQQCATIKTCPTSLQGDIDSANTLANVSNVGFGVAAVGAVIGVVGLVMAPRSKQAPQAVKLQVSPLAGGAMLGAGGRF